MTKASVAERKRILGRPGKIRAFLVVAVVAALAVAAAVLVSLHAMVTLGQPVPRDRAAEVSVTVLDRKDTLLRAFTTGSGHWRLPVGPEDVDARYLSMLIAFEDRRFWSHRGADPIAFIRAAAQAATHGRLVSGGSTLTMQTARLLRGPTPKTMLGKLRQVVDALKLERSLSKREILAHYLQLAPYGGNMEGVRAASIAYFGKEPRRLSLGEAALLVAIPQSPEARRPDRSPDAARRARDRVLATARKAGIITSAEYDRAKLEPVPRVRREFPKLAPHLADAEVEGAPLAAVHRTTLDAGLQASLEELARDHARTLGDKLSAAVIVADHRSGAILARVGSAGYLDGNRWGAVDMAAAVRSPGSTLKPLIYGLGFDAGIIHPETLIEDRPVRFGSYAPKNFDEDFHGTVSIRDALAQSLNIPAVKVLNAIGPGRLWSRLKRSGATPVLPASTEPTVAIALGGIGLKLDELAGLYAALARGGEPVILHHRRDGAPEPADRDQAASSGHGARRAIQRLDRQPASLTQYQPSVHRAGDAARAARRVLSPVAAWYVTDILKDAPPPANAIGGRFAYKTGTSYGYRDAYAIGFDGAHVVAVWIGRPDSAATPGLSGRVAAAPLLFDAFARLGEARAPLPGSPPGAIVASGAELPPPLKRFREPGAESAIAPSVAFLDRPPVISYPHDRSEIEAETGDASVSEAPAARPLPASATHPDAPLASIVLRADGGVLPLTWLVDGEPLSSEPHRRDAEWRPGGRGFVSVSVIDATGKSDRVVVRLR